jgi:hypothetical protein
MEIFGGYAMSTQLPVLDDTMECPLCLGKGQLRRAEVLERLGMKDFARIAQLSAEEAFRLLLQKHTHDEGSAWLRFEAELHKRTAQISENHKAETQRLQEEKSGVELRLTTLLKNQEVVLKNARESERLEAEKQLRQQINELDARVKELVAATKLADEQKALEIERVRSELQVALRSEQSEKEDLNRRVEDYFKEIKALGEKNHELQAELSKVARVGKREELDFAADARTWPGISTSEKLPKSGDYILAYRDPAGVALEPRILVDNKDKESVITEGDIDKLVRDARLRSIPVAALVTRDENQLRQGDREMRWSCKDEVWILRTTRQWLPRDLEVLKPLFERMRAEGPDFLEKNVLLAEEVRRTFVDIDGIERELKKASNALKAVSELVSKYRNRLQTLCDASCTHTITLNPLTNALAPAGPDSTSEQHSRR